MDVNGTRFHLILGENDWRACREVSAAGTVSPAFWNDQAQGLTLHPQLSLFRPAQPGAPLAADARRGAATDRFGNWYWIGSDRRTLYLSGPALRPRVFWSQTSTCSTPTGGFHPVESAAPVAELAGLAVTEQQYLVVGNVTQRGLFVFDLHGSEEPLVLLFPHGIDFEPFDLAPAPGGGVWVLDRAHRAYWGLDRTFRVVTDPALLLTLEPGAAATFHPVGGTVTTWPGRQFPKGFALAAQRPLSIEALPDGSVLILDEPAASPASALYRYILGDQQGPSVMLALNIDTETNSVVTTSAALPVIGHDLAYLPDSQLLYVADEIGKQVFAFKLDYSGPQLTLQAQADYLPLRAYGGRALVAQHAPTAEADVFYDLTGPDPQRDASVRWLAVRPIAQPRYQRSATVLLSATSVLPSDPPHFDGKQRGCVWHRLLMDACIPPETSVEVLTRANDSLELLESMPFLPEPPLYQRGAGAEIPFYSPFPGSTARNTGTWELLFQAASGRFLQVQLVLRGNGLATPHIQAARIYYPRFSYPKRYLPAVYQDEPESAWFLERLLANPEGFYTEIEGKMILVGSLFDSRSAPSETLDWLAGWWGLVLDPLWARLQEQRQVTGQPAVDRRRLFIRFARKLYDRRGTPDGIQFALHLLLDPCLEQSLQALKDAAIQPNRALRDTLARLGLPYPSPVMSDAQLEDILYDFVLSSKRGSKVRIVERFMTRNGRALVVGDSTPQTIGAALATDAHTFSVLIPDQLSVEEAAMVRRIVGLEKPAHTLFDVRRYFDYFRVGEARLGIDTTLGEDGRFVAIVLGGWNLASGYLAAAPPMDVADRVIANRDRLGSMPAL